MEKAWCYLVVSSDAQEESLEAQRRWGLEEAKKIGVHVERIFEGVSTGKHGARKLLVNLIEELQRTPKAQRPSRVLMVRVDRTGRMPLDAISALNELRKLGVIIRTRTDGDLTFGRVIDQVGPIFQLLQAGFENEVRSDRSKAGYQRRRDEGKLVASKPPYGIMRGKDGKAATDPQCAPFVQEAYRRWNAGGSPAEIVAWLRAKAPPRQGKSGPQHIQWSLSHLYKMVHLETYKGVIIDERIWERAQRRRKPESKPGSGGRVYPFSGMRCSCGERLHPRTNTAPTRHVRDDGVAVIYPRKKMTRWYVCQSLRHPTGPRFRSFREDTIEAAWVKILSRLAVKKGPWVVRERSTDYSARIASLERKIAVLDARRERIHAAFEDGSYSSKVMQERLAVVDAEQREARGQIADLEMQVERSEARRLERSRIRELLMYAAKLYEKGTVEERARINRAIFSAFGAPTITDGYKISLPLL